MAKITVEVPDNVFRFLTNFGAFVGVEPKTLIEQEIKTFPVTLIDSNWTDAFYVTAEEIKKRYGLG